jgi:hypothetical protein
VDPVFAEIEPEPSEVRDDRIPEISSDAVLDRVVEVDASLNVGSGFRENDHALFHRLIRRA